MCVGGGVQVEVEDKAPQSGSSELSRRRQNRNYDDELPKLILSPNTQQIPSLLADPGPASNKRILHLNTPKPDSSPSWLPRSPAAFTLSLPRPSHLSAEGGDDHFT